MSKPEQRPELPPQKIHLHWFRPAFWLGFNLLACFPAIKPFGHIDGTIFWGEDTNLAPFLVPVSVLAVVIGVPFAVWQISKRLKQKQSALWEVIGVLLCACPYFVGTNAFPVMLRLLNVDVQGHE